MLALCRSPGLTPSLSYHTFFGGHKDLSLPAPVNVVEGPQVLSPRLSLSLSLSLSPNTACILGSVPLRWRRNGCAQAKEIRKLVEVTRGYIEKLNVRPPVQLKEPPPHTNALTQQVDQSRTFHPFCTPSAPLLHPFCTPAAPASDEEVAWALSFGRTATRCVSVHGRSFGGSRATSTQNSTGSAISRSRQPRFKKERNTRIRTSRKKPPLSLCHQPISTTEVQKERRPH